MFVSVNDMTLNQAPVGRTITVKKINCDVGERSRLRSFDVFIGADIIVLKNCGKLGCVVRSTDEPVGISLNICKRITVE